MTEKPFLVDIYECELSGHYWIKEDWVISGYHLYRCAHCFAALWSLQDD